MTCVAGTASPAVAAAAPVPWFAREPGKGAPGDGQPDPMAGPKPMRDRVARDA